MERVTQGNREEQAEGVLTHHPSLAHLGPDVLQLPILQPPEYMLCAVPTNAKVKRVQRREELPPDLWARNDVCTGHQPLPGGLLNASYCGLTRLYERSLVKSHLK